LILNLILNLKFDFELKFKKKKNFFFFFIKYKNLLTGFIKIYKKNIKCKNIKNFKIF